MDLEERGCEVMGSIHVLRKGRGSNNLDNSRRPFDLDLKIAEESQN